MGRWSILVGLVFALSVPAAHAPQAVAGEAEKVRLVSRAPFAVVARALEKAIADEKMGLVCHANAQAGAAARGVKIAGNQVLEVFRNDYAVRMLRANPEAGFEAPIRIYLYERPDGTATLVYRKPSAVFRPYGHPELDTLGAELDEIFDRIARQAMAAR